MEYHKINTIYKREMTNNSKKLLISEWSQPEFGYLQDNLWVFTEKIDGTNIRVMLDDAGNLTFGGRTDNAQIPTQLLTRLQERFIPQKQKMVDMFRDGIVIFGEGYGPKIQKGGGNYRSDQDFIVFDIRIGSWWLTRDDVAAISHELGLDTVPVYGCGTLHDAVKWAQAGIPSTFGDFQAEGVVGRPMVELKARNGQRIICKIKCKDFYGLT